MVIDDNKCLIKECIHSTKLFDIFDLMTDRYTSSPTRRLKWSSGDEKAKGERANELLYPCPRELGDEGTKQVVPALIIYFKNKKMGIKHFSL